MESLVELVGNRLPAPTWNWLHMNKSVLKGEDAKRLQEAKAAPPVMVCQEGEEEKQHFFRFVCEAEENKIQEVKLRAGEGSDLTVWMEFTSPQEGEGLLKVSTDIQVQKNARVRLVQVQLLGAGYRLVNEIRATCEADGHVELLQMFLGGVKTWAGFLGNLNGPNSSVTAEVGYWCRNTQRLDMNYVVLHNEKQTKSQIQTRGVLEEQAFKLFRGTIDFKKGASGSEGEETEEVLLLGEDVVNQTIPLILCGEEDVRGNHGATIGEPDEEMLFYLAARGIEKSEATALLARAKLDGIRTKIGNRDLEERVKLYLEGVSGNE